MFNVNGLGNYEKRREMWYFLKRKSPDFIFLQETHFSKTQEKQYNTEWGSKVWNAYGQPNARGVSILFSNSVQVQVHNVIKDEEGKLLILFITLHKQKFLLANIYAPNQDDVTFFQRVFKEIDCFTPDHLIIAGDFNLALESMIDRKGTVMNNDQSASWFEKTM